MNFRLKSIFLTICFSSLIGTTINSCKNERELDSVNKGDTKELLLYFNNYKGENLGYLLEKIKKDTLNHNFIDEPPGKLIGIFFEMKGNYLLKVYFNESKYFDENGKFNLELLLNEEIARVKIEK